MRSPFDSFYVRLAAIFLLLILALGGGCIAIAFRSAARLFDDVEQLLNREYARSISQEISPLVAQGFSQDRVQSAIHYMMVLNPMVEIYLLDARGKILAYFLNPAEKIVRGEVALAPVKAFVDSNGRKLALGDDPRSAGRSRPFSAAPLRMGAEDGYVYIILGGERYDASLRMIRDSYYLRAGLVAFILALLATLIVGLSLFSILTRRLRSLTLAVQGFERGDLGRRAEARGRDELGALGRSFNEMAATIEADVEKLRQAERMRTDLIGNISHDLRTPLASIQGYLETLEIGRASCRERV
jgi:methyl-accepting chemotaxis protein